MTIKALQGGKLLCLMATVAGVMTLGSCKDDDKNDPEPTPEPVQKDTTPKKVTYPDEYAVRLNDSTIKVNDTIVANTLLNAGVNSDKISVDVVLRNGVKVDLNTTTFTLKNDYLGTVDVAGESSVSADSIYSITFPAIEGTYTLKINGKATTYHVVGSKALSVSSRSFSNNYTASFDAENTKLGNVLTFTPYTETEESAQYAKLSGDGKFVALEEDAYNDYISSNKGRGLLEVDLKDVESDSWKSTFNNGTYFAFQTDDKIYLGKVISFDGETLRESSSVKVSIVF